MKVKNEIEKVMKVFKGRFTKSPLSPKASPNLCTRKEQGCQMNSVRDLGFRRLGPGLESREVHPLSQLGKLEKLVSFSSIRGRVHKQEQWLVQQSSFCI